MNKFKVVTLTIVLVLIGGVVMFNKDISADEDNPESMSQNIINSPGAEAYQAGRDIYINPKKPARHLTNDTISSIDSVLNSENVKKARILYTSGNAEAQGFASEIAEYLKSKNVIVEGPYGAMIVGNSTDPQSMFVNKQGVLIFHIQNYN